MTMYKEWLEQEVPLQLFHYTTKDGFLGIIKNKQLWASHILYQNDYTEYNLALDILKETINNNTSVLEQCSIDTSLLLDEMSKLLNKSIYVISLSEEKDLLSQWRGYANSNPGFCIGFRKYYLNDMIKTDNNIVIAKCIYDRAKQNSFMLELLVDSVGKIKNATMDPNFVLSSQIAFRLMNYAPLIKHEKFKEESEWRIIISNKNHKDQNFDIRTGKSFFIPYYKLDFYKQEAIGDIIIGPCPDKKMAYNSTLFACYSNDIEFINPKSRELLESKIPFRNW